MGFFTNKAKEGAFDKFIPLELNEDNVNTIYKSCLPLDSTNKEDIAMNYIFLQKNGFDDNNNLYLFDRNKLNKEYNNIAYMLGQLYEVHFSQKGFLYLKNFSLNYQNRPWFQTTDIEKARETVFHLIALGTTVRNAEGFVPIGGLMKDDQAFANIQILPTLSPKDPQFEEWSKSEKGKQLLLKFQKPNDGRDEK